MKLLDTTVCALLCVLVASATAATQSFDPATGRIAVDMAAYMAKHQIAFNGLVSDSNKAIPVGNGRVGAMVWNARGLTLQVSNVDGSPQGEFGAGRVQLNTSPGIDANPGTIQQILSPYDGAIDIRYGTGRTVKVFGVPGTEIIGIHVEDARTNVQSVTLDLGVWDPSTRMAGRWTGWSSMMVDVNNVTDWKTVSTLVQSNAAGISRAQSDAWNFGYTLAASVEGASFTTSQVDSRNVRLSIVPSTSYTIWIVCASRMNAANHNSATAATQALVAVASKGYAATLSDAQAWWHAFWAKSFVQYSNTAGDADFLESHYYLSTYLIASGSYGRYPFHFINGIYRTSHDSDVHWSGGYWYWNSRDVYDGLLASNHADAMWSFYKLYAGVYAKLKTYTQTKWSIDGIWVPETMRWDGDAKYTVGSDYTEPINSTGSELAMNMYAGFRYTGDSAFLKDTVYPFMREAAKFLSAKFVSNGTNYNITSSNAHETYWNVTNPITDLAAVRNLFPKVLDVSQALGQDATLRNKWQDVLAKLAAYKTETVNGQTQWLPNDLPKASSHNVENITCELAWPYNQTGVGSSTLATAVQSFKTRPFPYNQIWSPDPIQAARLGLGDSAFNGMKKMLVTYQDRSNGFSSNTNGTFEYVGTHIQAINESMLHSWNDTIRVFPAVPSGSTFTGRFTLLAQGGFLVSSEKTAGEIGYVGLKSLRGERAVVANPWGNEAIQAIVMPAGIVVGSSSSAYIAFGTTAGSSYVVERLAKPFSQLSEAPIATTTNGSGKSMTAYGRTATLGFGTGSTPGVATVRLYRNTDYDGIAASIGVGSWTKAQLAAQGVSDNDVSSMEVDSGLVVELFDDDGFATPLGTFRASVATFVGIGLNDKVTSIRISKEASTRVATDPASRNPSIRAVDGRILVDGLAEGTLQLVDLQGRSRIVAVASGSADARPVPSGLYRVRIAGSPVASVLLLVP